MREKIVPSEKAELGVPLERTRTRTDGTIKDPSRRMRSTE
jgi:hypothetical protein